MIMQGKSVLADKKDLNDIRSIMVEKIIFHLKRNFLLEKTRTKPIIYKK